MAEMVTDCKGIIDAVERPPQDLTTHDKALARTWLMVRSSLDDDLSELAERIAWMPSHTTFASVGLTTLAACQ